MRACWRRAWKERERRAPREKEKSGERSDSSVLLEKNAWEKAARKSGDAGKLSAVGMETFRILLPYFPTARLECLGHSPQGSGDAVPALIRAGRRGTNTKSHAETGRVRVRPSGCDESCAEGISPSVYRREGGYERFCLRTEPRARGGLGGV